MFIVQVVFFGATLFVPYWFWSHRAETKPGENWSRRERNLARIIDQGGGMESCSTAEIVDMLRGLCDSSEDRRDDYETFELERSTADVLFGCEATEKSDYVLWRRQKGEGKSCGDFRPSMFSGGELIFELDRKGYVKSMAFNILVSEEERRSGQIKVTECRQRLKNAKTLQPAEWPDSRRDFLSQIIAAGDISETDVMLTNLCLTFDLAPGWVPFRKFYEARD